MRLMLIDRQRERIAPELSGRAGNPGSSGRENRIFIEAVLWIARTDSTWRVCRKRSSIRASGAERRKGI